MKRSEICMLDLDFSFLNFLRSSNENYGIILNALKNRYIRQSPVWEFYFFEIESALRYRLFCNEVFGTKVTLSSILLHEE